MSRSPSPDSCKGADLAERDLPTGYGRRQDGAEPVVDVQHGRGPFAEFRPDGQDARAAEEIYGIVLGRVAALLGPDRAGWTAKDAAIGLFATVHGLVALETSGLLGSGAAPADRRFRFVLTAALRGLADAASHDTASRPVTLDPEAT